MVILRNLYFTGTGSGPGTPLYSETSDKGHSAKEDKPPNKGQAESTLVYTLYKKKSPLKEDNLSTKDKTAAWS